MHVMGWLQNTARYYCIGVTGTVSIWIVDCTGIVKPGAMVFTPSTLHPDAMKVVRSECTRMQATLHVVDTSSAWKRTEGTKGDTCVG